MSFIKRKVYSFFQWIVPQISVRFLYLDWCLSPRLNVILDSLWFPNLPALGMKSTQLFLRSPPILSRKSMRLWLDREIMRNPSTERAWNLLVSHGSLPHLCLGMDARWHTSPNHETCPHGATRPSAAPLSGRSPRPHRPRSQLPQCRSKPVDKSPEIHSAKALGAARSAALSAARTLRSVRASRGWRPRPVHFWSHLKHSQGLQQVRGPCVGERHAWKAVQKERNECQGASKALAILVRMGAEGQVTRPRLFCKGVADLDPPFSRVESHGA